MRKINVLKPNYYDKFQCIADKCRNSCCQNWDVIITKEEFKRLKRSLQSEEMKKKFADAFYVKEGTFKTNQNYLMKFDENNKCKFLDENNLCKVYQECGFENMFKICQVFPRASSEYMDFHIKHLSIGCEEVLRLFLEEKDGIFFEPPTSDDYDENALRIANSLTLKRRPLLKYYSEIFMMVLAILQFQKFSIYERIVLLGIALEKIKNMEEENHVEEVPQYCNTFLKNLEQPEIQQMYRDFFEKTKQNDKISLANATIYYLNVKPGNLLTSQLLKTVKQRLNIHISVKNNWLAEDEQLKMEIHRQYDFDLEKYVEQKKLFETFLEGKEHLLENMAVNMVLYLRLPCYQLEDIWKIYTKFVIVFNILKVVMIGYTTEDFTEQQWIDCIVDTARNILHNQKYMDWLEETLKKNQSNSLAHLAMLVL